MTSKQVKFSVRMERENALCGSVGVTKYLNIHTPELP